MFQKSNIFIQCARSKNGIELIMIIGRRNGAQQFYNAKQNNDNDKMMFWCKIREKPLMFRPRKVKNNIFWSKNAF